MLQSDHVQNTSADEDEQVDDFSPNTSEYRFGLVVAVDGSRGVISIDTAAPVSVLETVSVGKLVIVRSVGTRVVCLVYANEFASNGNGGYQSLVKVEILGEIRSDEEHSQPHFNRGVSSYPFIGAAAEPIKRSDLEIIYSSQDGAVIDVGNLVQDDEIKATLRTDDMMQKHFAVLGSTGVGKSTSVSLILSKILEGDDKTRILLIDPHNEYKRAFGEKAHVVSPTNLRLPFWLFNFEEFTDALFRGRPVVDEEVAALAEFIPAAKAMFASNQTENSSLARREPDGGYTVDTPVPYRLSDLVSLLDKELGSLGNKGDRPALKKLKSRIESISRDTHYQFMFASLNVDDSMGEILQNLFRIPHEGKPITILELAGFPSEVVNSVVSVVCRMAFDIGLWSNSRVPVLVVAEEAHRYVPADRTLGFGPTRRAISRIAKEGRKYGVYLGVITQRPAELDPTIISQCSTIFAMRMANENDHAIIRSAVSDAAASILAFLPSIGNREAIAFGEGVAMPMRMRFLDLEDNKLPSRQDIVQREDADDEPIDDSEILKEIVHKWRTAEMRENRRVTRFSTEKEPEEEAEDPPSLRRAVAGEDPAEQARPRLRRDDPPQPTLRRPGFGNAGGFGR